MGLIKAAKDSISTLLSDQWRECFYCDSLSSDVLVKKGQKQVTAGRNSNTKGLDNIISNGSVVIVNEGQCMIIVDQGGVVDFCAEAGEFIYDTSTEPSLLYGELGDNIKNTFDTAWRRFTFGGNTGKDQRVYYFNTKEIIGNRYGTATPIDFHIVSPVSGLHMETVVKCNGEYTFKIVDPLLFYKNVCGNVKDEFNRTSEEGNNLMTFMKRELLSKLPSALAPIAAQGVLPYQLSGHTEEICAFLKQDLSEMWTQKRGLEVVSMTITASVPDDVREKLNEWNNRAAMANDAMALASDREAEIRKKNAFADFMTNSSMGGSGTGSTDPMGGMMSMMAMNMMGGMMGGNNNMMGNNMMGGNNMMNNGASQQPNMGAGMNTQPVQLAAPILGWTCSCGKTDNRSKFCEECGSKKPEAAGWTCSCGQVNQGKFCPNCGSKRPEGAPLYKCDKCGWEPEDPTKPPKFCPECGDAFDENDRQ